MNAKTEGSFLLIHFCDSQKGLNLILLKCKQTGKWPLQMDLIESSWTGLNLVLLKRNYTKHQHQIKVHHNTKCFKVITICQVTKDKNSCSVQIFWNEKYYLLYRLHDRKTKSAELPCMSQYFLDLFWCCKVMVVVESLHLGKKSLAFRISTTSATVLIPDLFCGPGLLIIWNCATVTCVLVKQSSECIEQGVVRASRGRWMLLFEK